MPKSRRPRKIEESQTAPAPPPAPSRRTALLVCLTVFVVLLLVYQATVLRTAVDQDSGELVAAAHVQGIPHPTGYPLWLLLGRLFDYLPLGGTSAYRVGMMSAVGVATAGALISLAALGLTGAPLPALCAGLAFGLWQPPWSDLARAMVHAITGLFVAISILALRRWDRERSIKTLLWLCLAVGFAAMHHRTSFLVLAPAFLAAFAVTPPRCRERYYALGWLLLAGLAISQISHVGMAVTGAAYLCLLLYALARRSCLRQYLAAVALFLAPFSFYAYLWLRALAHPAVNWTDPTTLDRLLYHALAKQYFGFALANSPDQMVEYAIKMVPELLAPSVFGSLILALLGLPLIVWGWLEWRKREPLLAVWLGVGCVALTFWVLKWGEAMDLKHFMSPVGPVLAIAGALGLTKLGALPALAKARRLVPAAAGLLLCATLAQANWARCDFHNRWANRDRWEVALTQMAPNAVFLSDFDQPSFVTLYLQNVERLRRDVMLIRTVRLPAPGQSDEWYLDLIEDRELREAIREVWPLARKGAPEIHDQTALLSYLLAQRLPNRAIYAVHGPRQTHAPGPPYFSGLSQDLVRLDAQRPEKLSQGEPATVADFPRAGIALVRFALDKTEAETGETVGFTAEWRLESPLPRAQFAVALLPTGMTLEQAVATSDTKQRLVQPFPVVYGQWGLAASPERTSYQQRGDIIIPTNAVPGEYGVAVAIAPLYTNAYEGWTEVGRVMIAARPRPRNGP